MRLSKNTKNKYDTCIMWFKSCKNINDINVADKISLFPFLNWYSEAKLFADYCTSIQENEIAKKSIESWNRNKI